MGRLIGEKPLTNNERVQRYNTKLRKEILILYGGNPPKCACCGERKIEFLTIDHINGMGNGARKISYRRHLYWWLKKNGFPLGYRVLCMNCNFAIGIHGFCPHSKKESP